jgi:hypothetical protein
MNKYQVFKAGPKKGQPKTLTDRVVRYLVEGRRMQEMPSKSRFRQFIPTGNNPAYYFVGKAGAIRSGRTASNSVSITDIIYDRMKSWEARLQTAADKANQILADAEQNINCLDKVIH